MKKILIGFLTIFVLAISVKAQKTEVKKDTIIITGYENISFIKIAGKIYKVKTVLEEIQPESYRNLFQLYGTTPGITLTGIDTAYLGGTTLSIGKIQSIDTTSSFKKIKNKK
ncbi:MAG: hypothetical protein JWO92_1112 [Chitinophagaceae bacterium]|nr:hypothetical protein [Chitinophagaceae bacterium]